VKLKIVQAGEPVLRQRARALTPGEIKSEATQQLIASMRETMRKAPGVGLAAPQIGQPIQLAVIEDRSEYLKDLSPETLDERGRAIIPFHVIINPELKVVEAGPAYFFEGCLSLTGFTAIVPRALAVEVRCLNEHGEPVTIKARGWYARILQHEIDHLNGKVYIDRMESRTFTTMDNFSKHWSDKPVEHVRISLGLVPWKS